MGIVTCLTFHESEFDFTKATTDDVYFAFVLTVPFRFRLKSPYQIHFENQGKEYDIWIRNNPIDVTEPDKIIASLIQRGVEEWRVISDN